MAEHKAICPACGGTLSADTGAELIQKIQQHGKEHHDLDLTEQGVKDMIAQQQQEG